jgi:hypothetical protein
MKMPQSALAARECLAHVASVPQRQFCEENANDLA